MLKDENELAQRLGVMGLADGKFIRSLHVDRLSPSAVAEALHEIADRLTERGLQAGRRARCVEPRGGYSAESDER